MRDIIVLDHATCINTEPLIAELWPGANKPLIVNMPAEPSPEKYKVRLREMRTRGEGKPLLNLFLGGKIESGEAGRIALIGFGMTGCVGLLELLNDVGTQERVDFVGAIDGLRGKKHEGQLLHNRAWAQMAERAAAGKACMCITYSHLRGFGFPSTRDSALHLAQMVGAFLPKSDDSRPLAATWGLNGKGLKAQEYSFKGDLHFIGAWPEGTLGEDGSAHVYHCTAIQSGVWRHFLVPRWTAEPGEAGYQPPTSFCQPSALPA